MGYLLIDTHLYICYIFGMDGTTLSSYKSVRSTISIENVRAGLTFSLRDKLLRLNGKLWDDSQESPRPPFLKGDKDGQGNYQGNSDAGTESDTPDT